MKKIKKMIKEFKDNLDTYAQFPEDYVVLAEDFVEELEQYVKTQQPPKKKD